MDQSLLSLEVVAFFVILFFLYYSIGRRFQWQILLIASVYFYVRSDRWENTAILFAIMAANYGLALLIKSSERSSYRRLFFWTCVAIDILTLILFRYAHHISEISAFDSDRKLRATFLSVVPLGLSYLILKSVGYVIDVYQKRIGPEKHLGRFALYFSFFLEISSGPIDRARNLLPQIRSQIVFSYDRVVAGSQLILWGLFKKFAIANNLANYVSSVYGSPRDYGGITLITATYLFAFQLYADFSGYTDIVRGAAKILGYEIPINFSSPYLSKSIPEFWTRWHISLSKWLRDYLFLPVSNFISRRLKSPTLFKIDSNVVIYFSSALVTFGIAGIWHGSAWTYIVWGLIHGLYLSVSVITRNARRKIRRRWLSRYQLSRPLAVLQTLFCFHLVLFSWVFFRAASVRDAVYIVKNIWTLPASFASFWHDFVNPFEQLDLGQGKYFFLISLLMTALLILVEIRNKDQAIPALMRCPNRYLRWSAYGILLLSIFLLGEFGLKEFVYVQF